MRKIIMGFAVLGLLFLSFIIGLRTAEKKQEHQMFEQLPLSKCDSLVMANDSLVTRMVTLENRLLQYQTGLSFLKDKDKNAYDYAINAGNLKFEDLW